MGHHHVVTYEKLLLGLMFDQCQNHLVPALAVEHIHKCFLVLFFFFLLNIVKEKKNITVWLNMTKALKHLENKT